MIDDAEGTSYLGGMTTFSGDCFLFARARPASRVLLFSTDAPPFWCPSLIRVGATAAGAGGAAATACSCFSCSKPPEIERLSLGRQSQIQSTESCVSSSLCWDRRLRRWMWYVDVCDWGLRILRPCRFESDHFGGSHLSNEEVSNLFLSYALSLPEVDVRVKSRLWR